MIPVHPFLVHFPVALIFTSAIFFSLEFVTENPRWGITGFWVMAGGLIGAVLAIISGNIAYSSLILTNELKKISSLHETLGWTATWITGMLLVWYYLRRKSQSRIEKSTYLFLLYLCVGGLGFSAWLGGKMVYENGGGVIPMQEILKQKRDKEQNSSGGTTVRLNLLEKDDPNLPQSH